MELYKTTDYQNFSGRTFSTNAPPRSRLYYLPPRRAGTAWIESLSSYVNRLAWLYDVAPQVLIAKEIVPSLKAEHHIRESSAAPLGAFCKRGAMSINGGGEVASDWVQALEHLTMRTDLEHLTIHQWGKNVPSHHLFRNYPAWCAACYDEWHEQKKPLYQPLLWMFQVITICPMHRRKLVERCSTCHTSQSVMATKLPIGYCTHCTAWLGAHSNTCSDGEIAEEVYRWQCWIVSEFAKLHHRENAAEVPRWEKIPQGLATCMHIVGEARRFANLTCLSESSISQWLAGKRVPSFESVLRLCYVLHISPLQMIHNDICELQDAIHVQETKEAPFLKHERPHVEHVEYALEFIQAVIDGREPTLGLQQIARRVEISARTLARHFPRECALATAQYQAHRRKMAEQHIADMREEIQEVILTLHKQGITPSRTRVDALLSNPNIMFTQAARDAWHTVRHELGIE